MRTSFLSVAILAITTVVVPCRGEDDFSALLADLSFSDSPFLNDPLTVANAEPADDLRPVPSGISMPELVMLEAEANPPAIALQDPIPAAMPESANGVDFDAAFALQEPLPQVQTQAVGHTFNHGNAPGCTSCAPQGCNRCDAQGCDSCEAERCQTMVCTPYTKPNLPASTLLQYFRSNACHSDVWDGYRQKCCHSNQVLHGKVTHLEVASKHIQDHLQKNCCNSGDCGQIIDGCNQCNAVVNGCSPAVNRCTPAVQTRDCNDCESCDVGCDG